MTTKGGINPAMIAVSAFERSESYSHLESEEEQALLSGRQRLLI